MLILVSGGSATVAKWRGHPNLGVLVTPMAGNKAPATGPWAADNASFSGFDATAYVRMLERIRGLPGCLWVTVPDVVADGKQTLVNYEAWHRTVRWFGLPPALVIQDGMTARALPWEEISAVFVGGSTPWKLGHDAAQIVAEAQQRGLPTHMGRVNSLRRLRYARAIGCDSADGTMFSRFSERWIPWALRWLESETRQGILAGVMPGQRVQDVRPDRDDRRARKRRSTERGGKK